jgi:diguanylate cyclase (GGDEF)-like protein
MAVTGEPIGVVIFDIDHFKQVNDRYGHAAGDAVLTEIAYQLRKALRSYETLCRLGGEEFVILLPGAAVADATRIAERVRLLVAGLVVEGITVTISCGVASAGGDDVSIRTVLAGADAALYEAKAGGRNQTRVHMPETVSS